MRKTLRVMMIVLTIFVMVCLAGCETIKAIKITYGTGEADGVEYNKGLYYRNDSIANNADPHVIWVSEEDDPINGGYYYMYGSAAEKFGYYEGEVWDNNICLAFNCFRSKNLTDWEKCGAADGYALVSAADDWTYRNFWAPEVIFDKETNTYYLYYSADRRQSEWGETRDASKLYGSGSFSTDACLAVATSSSPMGPFKNVREGTDFDGNEITNECLFDIKKHFNLNDAWSVIDASIFRDDDGSLYLYFAKTTEESAGYSTGVWGMKLKDYITPDFSTIRCLTMPGYASVNFRKGDLAKKDEVISEGTVEGSAVLKALDATRNEGPFMYKHNNKYYLTFSPQGFKQSSYCVMQAVSDDPLGLFIKPDVGQGNPVVSTAASQISYISATGHHCFVETPDGVLYSVYARAGNPINFDDAGMRFIGADKCGFTTFGEFEFDEILYCNGPTISLQPLPESLSGYKNLAKDATITVSSGHGKEFLNDDKLNVMSSLLESQFSVDGKVLITIEFEEAVSVCSLMIYNSSVYDTAFKSIDTICLYYAEENEYDCAVIQNLQFPLKYIDSTSQSVVLGAAAVADFNEIIVNKITIAISQKYVTKDRLGNEHKTIGIGEIVVLGK